MQPLELLYESHLTGGKSVDKMSLPARFVVIGLFFGLFGLSSGLYFHIGETERKCFIEEIPDETMVTGKHFLLNDKQIK